ncbi:uncharacterized protein ISCGN_011012 [Ixodes scapularis]
MSSPEGDRGGACTTSRVSQFVDDACLKQVTLDDAEETKALREDSVGTTDPRVVLACRRSYPLSAVGALRLALLATSLLSLACLASAGTGDYDVLDLPLAERVRLHIFACVFSFLLMAALALADISSLVLPCNWVLVDTVSCGACGLLHVVSSSLLLHSGHMYSQSPLVAERSGSLFAVAGVLGLACALLLLGLAGVRWCQPSGRLWGTPATDIMMAPMAAS